VLTESVNNCIFVNDVKQNLMINDSINIGLFFFVIFKIIQK